MNTPTARGDLASITDTGTTITYGFDPLGRLVDYDGAVAYTYDGLDRVATRNSDTFAYTGTMLAGFCERARKAVRLKFAATHHGGADQAELRELMLQAGEASQEF